MNKKSVKVTYHKILMMKKITIIGLLGFVLISTNCNSQEQPDSIAKKERKDKRPPRDGKDPFVRMDVNKDGLLTKKEARGPISKDFDKIDLDKDGIISREEFDKAPKPKRGKGRPPRKEK